jgi:uncharacterized membrane protein YfcA
MTAAAGLRQMIVPTVATGFVVGIAGGLIGLGGAELRLPYLVGVLLMAPPAAVPVNLAVSLITVLASLPVRLGSVDSAALMPWLPVVLAVTAGAMLAAYVGAGWLRRIPPAALALIIGALLVFLGLLLLLEAALPLVPTGALPDDLSLRIAAGVAFGLVLGAISSLLGVAGGEVIIPTLVIGYGVPIALAGTLSLLVSLPTIVVGMARHGRAGAFANAATTKFVILPLAFGALFGAPLGGLLAAYAPAALIKVVLGGLLIWSAWKVFGKHA